MSNTAVRYLTMLRMVPRYPRSITTTELASRLEEQGFSVTMRSIQRDLEKLSADIPSGSDVVVIVHDDGTRYMDTIYNDDWVEENL